MSDTVVQPPGTDRRRTLASFVAAFAVHLVILLLISIAVKLNGPKEAENPIPIELQLQSGPEVAEPAPATSPAPGSAPSSTQAAAVAGPAAAPATGGDFVIPQPRGNAPDTTPSTPAGASFREAGAKTGAGASLPAVQNQLPPPSVAASQQGKGSGAGTTTGTGVAPGSGQRSGEGALVEPDKRSGSTLDLGKLDQALAGRGTGATGAAKGNATAGSATAGGSGQGGTGGGQLGAGGGAGSPGPSDYRVVWESPDASKGRELVSAPKPKIPQWVSTQGLTLSVTVAFILMPDGVVTGASLVQSSGYADVDSAIMDAIRRWRFTASKGAGSIKGVIPYIIKSK